VASDGLGGSSPSPGLNDHDGDFFEQVLLLLAAARRATLKNADRDAQITDEELEDRKLKRRRKEELKATVDFYLRGGARAGDASAAPPRRPPAACPTEVETSADWAGGGG
jgi:hypothetical protein